MHPRLIVRFRWPILIGFVIATALVGLQLRNVAVETDLQELIPDTMPSRADTERIEEIFGASDMLFLVLETDNVLQEQTLRRVKKLSKELSRVDGVEDVLSLFETKRIVGRDGAMIVEPAVDTIPETPHERERLRDELRENELAAGIVVSRDFRMTSIILTLDTDASEDRVYTETMALVDEYPGEETVHLGGQPAFRAQLRKDVIADLGLLIPVALLVMLAVLFAFFRQIRGIVLPFTVVTLSMVFGLGLLPLFGWELTLLASLLPVMIVAIANNYGIHIVARYQELSRAPGNHTGSGLAVEVFSQLSRPVLVTGLTTIVGILGLLMHVMIPAKQIGIAAAVAIGFSLLLSLLLIPAALSLLKVPANDAAADKTANGVLHRALALLARGVTGNPKTVLGGVLVVAALGCAGAFLIEVDASQERLFAPDHPITRSARLIDGNFGGSRNISVLVEGDIKDPRLLERLQGYQRRLERMPGVGQTNSIADVIRVMSKALNDPDEPGYDRIPPTRNAVAQYVELYSMSGDPEDFERMVDFNYEKAHLVVRIDDGATPVVKRIVGRVREIMRGDRSLRMIGGFALIMAELGEAMFRGQIASLAFAVVAIALLMMMLFRSPAAGLIATVPLAVSVILAFGIMGFGGIKLDVATAMITSIVIGTGVDYTIHFLWRYREELRTGKPHAEAVTHTLTTTGRSIAFNALSVVAGFSALLLSSLPPLRVFALLFDISILTCMVGALVTVPAVCLVVKPRFLEPKGCANHES